MNAADRLTALMDEYEPSEVVIPLDVEGISEPWLLIEQNLATEEYYFTYHRTPNDAGEYNVTQESAGWDIVKVVNVNTGEELEPITQPPKWQIKS